jgi:hypothetical protein
MKRLAKGSLSAAGIVLLAWSAWDYGTVSQLQSDEARALTPSWTVSHREIQRLQSVSFEFRWPTDVQWQRIAERWESPPFYIACFKPAADPNGASVGIPWRPLECRVLRGGAEIPTVEREHLMTYPHFVPGVAWLTEFQGLVFRAEPGDPLRVEIVLPKDQALPPGILAVGPYLRGGLVKDMMIGRVVIGGIAQAKAVLGCLLLIIVVVMVYLDRGKGKRNVSPPAGS